MLGTNLPPLHYETLISICETSFGATQPVITVPTWYLINLTKTQKLSLNPAKFPSNELKST